MKTPLTYYGGKQNMLVHIKPLIPKHRIYVEPFVGGGAFFFAKEPSEIEVLNDINGNISAFYRAMKFDFKSLEKLINGTLHDEFSHKKAKEIFFSDNKGITDIERAFSVWILSKMSFASDFSSGYSFVKNKSDNWHPAIRIRNAREQFKFHSKRLELVSIHNDDAINVIVKRDTADTFQFLDPPYPNARQGHYKGYTFEDFKKLLETISCIKSKFILSSYNSEILDEFIDKNKWNSLKFDQRSPVSGKNFRKTEVITFNFPIEKTYNQGSIFY